MKISIFDFAEKVQRQLVHIVWTISSRFSGTSRGHSAHHEPATHKPKNFLECKFKITKKYVLYLPKIEARILGCVNPQFTNLLKRYNKKVWTVFLPFGGGKFYEFSLRRRNRMDTQALSSLCVGYGRPSRTSTSRGFLKSQPDSAIARSYAWTTYLECFHVCFSCEVSLIKTIINYYCWQFDGYCLFKNINALAEVEPEKLRYLWNSLVQPQPKYKMCIFLKENNIQSNCQEQWLIMVLLHRKNIHNI